jgi:hypothetical protein
MTNKTSFGVTNVVASTMPCSMVRVQGYNSGVDAWLQIFNLSELPTNGAVPLKSFAIPQTLAFSWAFDPTNLDLGIGLVVALSTTEATLTIGTGGNVMDVEVDFQENCIIPNNCSTSGDMTTACHTLTVWAKDTSAPVKQGLNTLYRVLAVDSGGVDTYLQVFSDTPSTGNIPVAQVFLPASVETECNFGDSGLVPTNKSAAGVWTNGCYLAVSSTSGTYTAVAANSWTLKAWYK